MVLGHESDDAVYAACVVYSSHDDYAMKCVLQGIEHLPRHVDARNPGLRIFALFHNQETPPADPLATFCRGKDQSRKLVIFASSESAMSPHVDAEIKQWLTDRSPDDIIIVLVKGTAVWDGGASRFDMAKSSALSPFLYERFAKRPIILDASWIPTKEGEQVPASRYYDLVRRLAAAIQDCPEPEIVIDPLPPGWPWEFLTDG